jgi:hypothetical protein
VASGRRGCACPVGVSSGDRGEGAGQRRGQGPQAGGASGLGAPGGDEVD